MKKSNRCLGFDFFALHNVFPVFLILYIKSLIRHEQCFDVKTTLKISRVYLTCALCNGHIICLVMIHVLAQVDCLWLLWIVCLRFDVMFTGF